MEFVSKFLSAPIDFLEVYILPFVVVLSILVFVHEWGHYIIARLCGVKIESFSIGFGREIFGWTDKLGTRWKISALPLGGYVQMFGDTDPSSAGHKKEVKEDGGSVRPFTEEEKKVAFYTQSVAKRSAIVFAGPAINFIFAIIILTAMFTIQGQPYTPPVVSKLVVGSPAEKAGVLPDDKIIQIDDVVIERFEDISQYVAVNLNKKLALKVLHSKGKKQWEDNPVIIEITPDLVELTDRFGFKNQRGRIGIVGASNGFDIKSHTLGSALVAAFVDVWEMSANTLQALGQMIKGTRSADELGGIIRIGAYAGDFAKEGIVSLIMFMALLSVNLGLINLLPIPLLDGGHLAFFALESVKGKPMEERFQEYALRFGMVFLLTVMLFATWNDLVQLKLIDYVKNLVS